MSQEQKEKQSLEKSLFFEMVENVKGWPAVLWGLVLGTGTFTFIILSFINASITTKVQASEDKVMGIMDSRKETRDEQHKMVLSTLQRLETNDQRIIELLIKNNHQP